MDVGAFGVKDLVELSVKSQHAAQPVSPLEIMDFWESTVGSNLKFRKRDSPNTFDFFNETNKSSQCCHMKSVQNISQRSSCSYKY